MQDLETPVTIKTYSTSCASSPPSVLLSSSSATIQIGWVVSMPYFIQMYQSILSAGTFFGALVAGDIADVVGRCPTIITGCVVFAVGCILQMALKDVLAAFAIGCLVAGRGVGFISTIIIL
ncbi:hypothetical protein R3P38DRAFT_3228278 [Favolaschia claudopus]|uniref:Major facilitator superfamily (MFS) profile domain-containing protein n=1 Tax=Favolaschia claudopus TaxID=2862362 RepID=A0AAV9ZQQ4_9AGAR